MRKWLNIYFSFSKREFNGLLVLIVLIALVTAIPSVYELILPEKDDWEEEISALQKIMQAASENNKPATYTRNKWEDQKKEKPVLFNFDPNLATPEVWQSFGLSVKQAAVIVKYTAKGGRFMNKEDLQRMYVISPQNYDAIAPYVKIGGSARNSNIYNRGNAITRDFARPAYSSKTELEMVAINSADTLQLDQIKGVGPAFARRIFKYRNRLGGFYKKEQLLEVFGLDSTKYEEIKGQISIDVQQITKIRINSVSFEDLRYHPYLNFKQVNAILQFRKQHGNYVNIADLKKVAILPAETADKLLPYISFEHD